jgi:hypothetical protein
MVALPEVLLLRLGIRSEPSFFLLNNTFLSSSIAGIRAGTGKELPPFEGTESENGER